MPSRKTRLTEYLAGLIATPTAAVDRAQWDRLRQLLAPISDGYLRRLLRASGVPLTPEVEGVRQDDFAQLERTLLAATDPARVLEAKRHAELSRRSLNVDRTVKNEMIEWMRVWLESPGLFPTWVRLRKATPTFQQLSAANFRIPDAPPSSKAKGDA